MLSKRGRQILLIVLGVSIIISFSYLYFGFPTAVNRDWLDFISSIGDGSATIALLILIFQVMQNEGEQKRNRAPKLFILNSPRIVKANDVPREITHWLEETEVEEIPKDVEYSDYRELYLRLGTPLDTNMYIEIDVENIHEGFENDAHNVQLELHLCYYETLTHNSKDFAAVYKFWCPPSPGLISGKGKRTFFLRCGRININKANFIEGKILGWRCENSREEKATSSNNFMSVNIPRTSLIEEVPTIPQIALDEEDISE